MKHSTGRIDGTVYEVPLDVSQYARSMGATAFTAANKEQFEHRLQQALQLHDTIVIEALVDPDEIPPTLARG